MADRLHSAALHLLRLLRTEDDVLGISPPRLSALSVVVYAGPLTIGALAHAEGVRPPTMTRLVDGLERDGLIVRERGPDDRRSVVVRATPDGSRLLRRGRGRRVEALAAGLRLLSERDLATLGRAADLMERVARPQRRQA